MVVVKIELWPNGDETKSKPLGIMTMSNDGTGSNKYGNYSVQLSHAGMFFGKRKEPWKSGKVKNFLRTASPYHLVSKALKACSIF